MTSKWLGHNTQTYQMIRMHIVDFKLSDGPKTTVTGWRVEPFSYVLLLNFGLIKHILFGNIPVQSVLPGMFNYGSSFINSVS